MDELAWLLTTYLLRMNLQAGRAKHKQSSLFYVRHSSCQVAMDGWIKWSTYRLGCSGYWLEDTAMPESTVKSRARCQNVDGTLWWEWATSFPYPYGNMAVTGVCTNRSPLQRLLAKGLERHFVEHL
jgi:hypothetical protein